MSKLDRFYRRFIVTSIFTRGWGDPQNMKRIMNFRKMIGRRDICQHLVPADYPVYIDKEESKNGFRLLDGHFMSPVVSLLPGVMPREVEIARFQMILPTEWKTELKPICLHLGGTGDHGFWRRRMIAKPLLQEEGIASILLENPYYGSRKPHQQLRSSLHNVSDLFVMGAGLILESLVLFNWLERQGYGPLGATGISMGGHMASLASTNWHKPLSLIPCMSWSTASGVFTHGVLSSAIPWDVLEDQYDNDDSYINEVMELIESPEPYWKESMYKEGQRFVHEIEEETDSDSSIPICDPMHSDSFNSPRLPHIVNHSIDTTLLGNQSSTGSDVIGSQTVKRKFSGNQPSIGRDVLSNQSSTDSIDPSQQSSTWKDYLSPSNSITSIQSMFKKTDVSKEQLKLDCKHFMRGVMDECTHLGNFSVPVDPDLIYIVAAERDAYIPRSGVLKLNELWPGSHLRYVPRGHISGFLFEQKEFRKAIADSFQKQKEKYY